MNTFGTIDTNDYTVHDYKTEAPISWELVSSSAGISVVSPDELYGSVTINRGKLANSNGIDPEINADTGIYEYVLRASVNHIFYTNNQFMSGSSAVTSSLCPLRDNIYVISVGQNFYGDRIKPGSFTLGTSLPSVLVTDDSYGNLIASSSGTGSYVGNIFYDSGIAVISQHSASAVEYVGVSGIKLVSGSRIYVDYSTDVTYYRHQVNVRIHPGEFNFSPFNPSILSTYTSTGSVTQSFIDSNIKPASENTWNLYNLMGSDVIKPYITSIGLYNDKYELIAVAKMSTPIQRTYSTDQIFIVRFDT